MTLLNFITALSWVWGSMMALCVFANVIRPDSESTERAASAAMAGVVAWAWLIARYYL